MSSQGSTNEVDKLRLLLHQIQKDDLDNVEIMDLARILGIDLHMDQTFSYHKYQVQLGVLYQLKKTDNMKADLYARLITETQSLLDLRKQQEPYLCCLVGCLFSTDLHRTYLKHLKRVHFRHTNFMFNYKKKCVRQFSSLPLLLQHVKRDHTYTHHNVRNDCTIQEDVSCRCDMKSCGGMKFKNINSLLRHMNTFHALEYRQCIFDSCDYKITSATTSRRHFRKKHTSVGKMKLKEKHLVVQNVSPNLNAERLENTWDLNELGCDIVNDCENDDSSLLSIEQESATSEDDSEVDDTDENFFLMQHADFLNRLSNISFVPANKVSEINDNFITIASKSQKCRELKINKCLEKLTDLKESQKGEILKESVKDVYLDAQKALNTEFKRSKFIKENFKYIEPLKIVLNKAEVASGRKADVFHYVPVKQSFKALITDKSFLKMLENERNLDSRIDDVIKDISDGLVFKTGLYFLENRGAFAALFYSDAVELSNPLGWAKGRHKIVQVFYTLCNIPRNQRSQID